jgi:hypothetical protein
VFTVIVLSEHISTCTRFNTSPPALSISANSMMESVLGERRGSVFPPSLDTIDSLVNGEGGQ